MEDYNSKYEGAEIEEMFGLLRTLANNIVVVDSGILSTIQPNTIYVATSVGEVTISAIEAPTRDSAQYAIHFSTSDTFTTLSLPSNVLWANGQLPTIEGNTYYELSIAATKHGESYVYKAVLTPFKPL